ncbi:S-layer homology domain-containing protein [Crocosphaera chwakensis]|uniref:SLH domain-containing protein n=1 Tax=Crocosphaera chwakensis CCY0110 TaxID=391612 RepID=A3ILJ2_9CHRO|nr:S-layer homology domain-containing protein [Crocosphaera chwakensis]EAZ92643.1 hypothetical protein CY0110_23791 [Crocosphaera chwakensis CCY0110]
MSKQFWKKTAFSLATILVIYFSLIGVSMGANFNPSTDRFKNDRQVPDNYLAQVTSISQLSDISPTDHYYEAVRSLVERYGCSIGYGDNTYRPTLTIVRAEVGSITNACTNAIEQLEGQNFFDISEEIEALTNQLADISNKYPHKRR